MCSNIEILGIETFFSKNILQKINAHLNALIEESPKNSTKTELVFGDPGSGKTYLLCPIAQLWSSIQHKAEVFISLQFAGAEFACCQTGFAKYHAIIIDNIGYVQQSRAERTVARIIARQGLKNIAGPVFTTGKWIKRKR